MCGIFGFVSNRIENAGEILVKGIGRLEYRGYDSVGLAVLNGSITVKKEVGTVEQFKRLNNYSELKAKIAIAHSRWSTHGGVTKENSHPHLSCNGDIAVVHNGIIENYAELKKELIAKGHIFKSGTDTEVVPHLIEEYEKTEKFEMAIRKALHQLKGSYAFLIINSNKKDELIAVKYRSPLVLGISERMVLAASDPVPILEYTDRVVSVSYTHLTLPTTPYV